MSCVARRRRPTKVRFFDLGWWKVDGLKSLLGFYPDQYAREHEKQQLEKLKKQVRTLHTLPLCSL